MDDGVQLPPELSSRFILRLTGKNENMKGGREVKRGREGGRGEREEGGREREGVGII